MTLVDFALVLAAVPITLPTGYLLVLTAASLGRMVDAPPCAPGPRFDVVVPAHDEVLHIRTTLASLLAVDYPWALFRVIVVADNCSDDTAEQAMLGGAIVLERNDPSRRGKGWALAHAFDRILEENVADAVVVVDADTTVSPNLLREVAAGLYAGARAQQVDYAVRNPDDSWRTQMMAIAFGAFHGLRSRARERLGLSCGLRGNGMCFTMSLLRDVPYAAYSVTEDIEYGLQLGVRGVRVRYVEAAGVRGQMPATAWASGHQRRRWEGGRRDLARRHVVGLLSESIRRRTAVGVDLALDLLVPPLSTLGVITALGCSACAVAAVHESELPAATWVWAVCAVGLLLYVLRGWWLSGTRARGLLALLLSPVFVAWKLLLRTRASLASEWVRTPRQESRGEVR
jgi:1,2-diacylglycerol 3-beta-glucosyltransferase